MRGVGHGAPEIPRELPPPPKGRAPSPPPEISTAFHQLPATLPQAPKPAQIDALSKSLATTFANTRSAIELPAEKLPQLQQGLANLSRLGSSISQARSSDAYKKSAWWQAPERNRLVKAFGSVIGRDRFAKSVDYLDTQARGLHEKLSNIFRNSSADRFSPDTMQLQKRKQQVELGLSQLSALRQRTDLPQEWKNYYISQLRTSIHQQILDMGNLESTSSAFSRVQSIAVPAKPHITETTSMLKSLAAFDQGLHPVQGFYGDQLSQKEVTTNPAGQLITQNGTQVVSSSRAAAGKNVLIYVLSPEGKLYATSPYDTSVHHSSFLKGQPVAAAGEIMTTGGKISYVNNLSGHYRPDAKSLMQMVEDARSKNSFAPNALVEFAGLGTVRASDLLQYATPAMTKHQIEMVVRSLPKYQSPSKVR